MVQKAGPRMRPCLWTWTGCLYDAHTVVPSPHTRGVRAANRASTRRAVARRSRFLWTKHRRTSSRQEVEQAAHGHSRATAGLRWAGLAGSGWPSIGLLVAFEDSGTPPGGDHAVVVPARAGRATSQTRSPGCSVAASALCYRMPTMTGTRVESPESAWTPIVCASRISP